METLVLTDRDVHELLPVATCIDVMQAALEAVARGESLLPLRTVLRLGDSPNAFATMPAVHGGIGAADSAIGAKVITVFPGNAGTPFDSHRGVVLLFDAVHGALLAIADASSITAIRTAAVSGFATRLLASPDASELALLGAGVLAMPHLDAIRAVRPIGRVRVWSRGGSRAMAFADRARRRHDIDVVVADSAQSAVDGAEVVCTITSSRTPVLEGAWLSPGTHVNAVGASLAHVRELDAAAVARASLFVDRRESAMAEAGNFLLARAEGAVRDAHIRGEIGEVSIGAIPGRSTPHEITLFNSVGLAVEDVAAVQFVHAQARARGVGLPVCLGGRRD